MVVSKRAPSGLRRRMGTVLMGIVLAFLASGVGVWGSGVAKASGVAPDNCTVPERSGNSWFIASGPLAYWWWWAYYGGPANPYAPYSGEACEMWTWNETSYSGSGSGNQADWFDVGGMTCGCGYDNSAAVWIPSADATTRNAEYNVYNWTGQREGYCPVNQDAISNQWVWLCNSNSFYLQTYGNVYLDDGTGERSSSTKVGFDAAQFAYSIQV